MEDVRRANVQAKCRLIIESLREVRAEEATPEDVRLHINDVINRCETILTDLSPTRVAVYGGIGTGKSRFINQLLQAVVVSAGGAKASTAVVNEIVSRRYMRTFKATVYFLSTRAIKERLEYVAETLKENRRADDPRLRAIMTMLQRCFNDRLSYDNPTPLIPNEENRVLVENIGRLPVVLERDSLKKLREALAMYSHFPVENNAPPEHWQAMTVDYIRIEGNFEHLPSNVIVVDSPGLFDAVDMKSQRALEAVDSWQQIWFADKAARFLGHGQTQQAFRELCATRIRMEKVSVVCTRTDDLLNREDEVDEEPLAHEALNFDELEEAARNQINTVLFEDANDDDVRREVHVPVGFVSNGGRREDQFGMDYWRKKLMDLGVAQQNALIAMEHTLNEVIDMLKNLGVRDPPPNFPRSILDGLIQTARDAIDTLMAQYANTFADDGGISQLYDSIHRAGLWGLIRGNTWKATMDIYRRGIFVSAGQHRRYIDVNSDISSAWVRAKDRDILTLNQFFTTFSNTMCQLSNQWQEQPAGFSNSLRIDVDRWHRRTTAIMRQAFDIATLAHQIRTDLTNAGVYGPRTRCPTRPEVAIQVAHLLNMQRVYHHQLLCEVAALRDAVLRYSQPVQILGDDILRVLQGLIDAIEHLPDQDQFYLNADRVPVDFICPLTLEIMDDPVCVDDGCVYERGAIETYFGRRQSAPCPLDNTPINRDQIIPHFFLQRRITLWREQNRIEEPGEWWIGMWEEIVARLREAGGDGEDNVDAEAA